MSHDDGTERDPVVDDSVEGVGDAAGVGPVAAVVLLVGAGLVIAGLTTLVPLPVLVVGLGVFVLGAALPLWSFWRRRLEPSDRAGSVDR